MIKMTKKAVEDNMGNTNERLTKFYKEAVKQTFKVWLKVEPNNTQNILKLIDEFLTNGNLKDIEIFDKIIYEEAAKRLYRNEEIPIEVKRLTKCKLPRIIELISNAPKHIIEQMIDSHNKLEEKKPIIEYGKQKIIEYLLTKELLDIQPFNLIKPNIEDLKELIEYQQIFEMKTEIIVLDKYDTIIKKGENEVKALFLLNEKKTENYEYPNELAKAIQLVRERIPKLNKEQWIIIETAIEILLNIYNKKDIENKIKRKVGRPKKKQKQMKPKVLNL